MRRFFFLIICAVGAVAQCNTGIAFSMMLPLPFVITGSFFVLVVLSLIASEHVKRFSFQKHLGYGLFICGGALNLWDRVRFSCVRDFLPLGYGLTNNPADWYITLGIGTLMLYYMRNDS